MLFLSRDPAFNNAWFFVTVTGGLSFVLLHVLMIQKLSDIYRVPRPKMLAAAGFSMAIVAVPSVGLVAKIYDTVWAFMATK